MSNSPYRGRFAPSPSGPLHLGSLMSATCSFLQAKSQQGQWLVRIEDVDTPRVVKGMASLQLKQLEAFGFEWDEEVIFQSSRLQHYHELLQQLINNNKIYACECTRKQLKKTAKTSSIGFIYPQNCINKALDLEQHALRFKTSSNTISFTDGVFSAQQFNIQQLSSDWVIKRVDGIYAYHLAVVADDAAQRITEVVRGVDLLALTPLHIDLQQSLAYPTPNYFHHPLIQLNGQKLSKQNHADAVDTKNIIDTLNCVLKALGQTVIDCNQLDEFWALATSQWDSTKIPLLNYSL